MPKKCATVQASQDELVQILSHSVWFFIIIIISVRFV